MEEAYASRASYGAPDWQVDAWVSTYTAIAAGELATVSRAVADLTGTPARTLAERAASRRMTADRAPYLPPGCRASGRRSSPR